MFKKKEVTEPSTQTVTELATKKAEDVPKQYKAITVLNIDGMYKLLEVEFNLEDATVLEEYKDRTSINQAFKIATVRQGILG